MPDIFQIEGDPQAREFDTRVEAETTARAEGMLNSRIERVTEQTPILEDLEPVAVDRMAYVLPDNAASFSDPENVELIIIAPSGTQIFDDAGLVVGIVP